MLGFPVGNLSGVGRSQKSRRKLLQPRHWNTSVGSLDLRSYHRQVSMVVTAHHRARHRPETLSVLTCAFLAALW